MHDAYELCQFFDHASYGMKDKVLLEFCRVSPDELLDIIRSVSEPWKAECAALVNAGRKIDAVKLWRAKTGLALKDAKTAVEAL